MMNEQEKWTEEEIAADEAMHQAVARAERMNDERLAFPDRGFDDEEAR